MLLAHRPFLIRSFWQDALYPRIVYNILRLDRFLYPYSVGMTTPGDLCPSK